MFDKKKPFILTTDDDPGIVLSIATALTREGFETEKALSGEEALRKLAVRRPDALILDINMPGIDGLEVCRRLRMDDRYYDLPILFLTARGTVSDVVVGLDAGADDYVAKPFDIVELVARVRALLRRSGQPPKNGSDILDLGPIMLDSMTYRVTIGGAEIQLTRTEHQLLRYLMEHPNQALSPYRLLEAVWEYPPRTGDPDLVRAHIRNLRAKLENHEAAHGVIRTIHGVGYMVAV